MRVYAAALAVDRVRPLPFERRAEFAARVALVFFAADFFFPADARAFLTRAVPTADAAAAPTTAATIPAVRDFRSD